MAARVVGEERVQRLTLAPQPPPDGIKTAPCPSPVPPMDIRVSHRGVVVPAPPGDVVGASAASSLLAFDFAGVFFSLAIFTALMLKAVIQVRPLGL